MGKIADLNDLEMLQKIVKLLIANESDLFYEMTPNDCGCSNAVFKKQFKTQEAFEISFMLSSL